MDLSCLVNQVYHYTLLLDTNTYTINERQDQIKDKNFKHNKYLLVRGIFEEHDRVGALRKFEQ